MHRECCLGLWCSVRFKTTHPRLVFLLCGRPPPGASATQVASQKALEQDRKAYNEVLKECNMLKHTITSNLGGLVVNSFHPKLQGQSKPYDAMLEEFKWLQSLPAESLQKIQSILPPGGVGTNDKFNSQSTVRACTSTLGCLVPRPDSYGSTGGSASERYSDRAYSSRRPCVCQHAA